MHCAWARAGALINPMLASSSVGPFIKFGIVPEGSAAVVLGVDAASIDNIKGWAKIITCGLGKRKLMLDELTDPVLSRVLGRNLGGEFLAQNDYPLAERKKLLDLVLRALDLFARLV